MEPFTNYSTKLAALCDAVADPGRDMRARSVLHASVLSLAALVHAANTPTAQTHCRHQLGLQTLERLSKVDQALERCLEAAREGPAAHPRVHLRLRHILVPDYERARRFGLDR